MKWTHRDQIGALRKRHGSEAGMLGVWGESVKADTQRGNRDLIVTANTADIDLEGEVVVPGGADTSHFKANGTVFVDHDYSLGSAVAKLRTITPRKGNDGEVKAWEVRMRMSDNALADDILKMAVGGHAPGSSIGFTASDRGPLTEPERKRYTKNGKEPTSIVRAWDWLELSLTYMPCNVACQALLPFAADESKVAELDGLVTKGLIRRETAVAFGLLDARPRCIMLV